MENTCIDYYWCDCEVGMPLARSGDHVWPLEALFSNARRRVVRTTRSRQRSRMLRRRPEEPHGRARGSCRHAMCMSDVWWVVATTSNVVRFLHNLVIQERVTKIRGHAVRASSARIHRTTLGRRYSYSFQITGICAFGVVWYRCVEPSPPPLIMLKLCLEREFK